MELRWREHGLGKIGMTLQFRDSTAMRRSWQNVPTSSVS